MKNKSNKIVQEKMTINNKSYAELKKSSRKALDFLKSTKENASMIETLEVAQNLGDCRKIEYCEFNSILEKQRIRKRKKK